MAVITRDEFNALPEFEQVGLLLAQGQFIGNTAASSTYRLGDFLVQVELADDPLRVVRIHAHADPGLS